MFEERRNAKRTAQRMLFEALTSKPSKVLGLAGDCPDKYKQVLEETIHPSKILLCDKHRYGGVGHAHAHVGVLACKDEETALYVATQFGQLVFDAIYAGKAWYVWNY